MGFAAQRTRRCAPDLEGLAGLVDSGVDRQRAGNTTQRGTGDRASGDVFAGCCETRSPAGAQRCIGKFGEVGRIRKSHPTMLPRVGRYAYGVPRHPCPEGQGDVRRVGTVVA